MAMLSPSLSDREVRHRLEAVARQAVLSPEIEAVVLFGSRARGDFRPDSDWDVALFARSDCRHPDIVATRKRIEKVDRYSEFGVWAQTTGHLQDYADRSNFLAGAVATQGVPLAGRWPLAPAVQEGRQFMDLEQLRAQQVRVCKFIMGGWVQVDQESSTVSHDTSVLSHFSCMAAELLATDIVSSHSVQPTCAHDLKGLSEQLEGLPLESWESEQQRRSEVETLRKMSGRAAKLHLEVSVLPPAEYESLKKCMQRLLLTMELQVSWLSRCAGRGADWNQAVRHACTEIVRTARFIRRLPAAGEQILLDILPGQAVQRISEWEASARRLV